MTTEETAKAEAPRNLDVWLGEELRLNESDPERVALLLERALEEGRYHSVARAGGGGTIRVSGRFGSKLWTTLIGMLPLGAAHSLGEAARCSGGDSRRRGADQGDAAGDAVHGAV